MKKTLLALGIVSSLAAAGLANAATPDSFYMGAHVGYAHSDPKNLDNVSFDKNGLGGGLFAGYSFNQYFSLEGDYNYFGGFKATAHDPVSGAAVDDLKYNLHGPEIAALVSYPLADNGTDVFLRGGVMYAFGNHDSRQAAPSLGAGANVNFTDNFGVRVGYTRYFNAYKYEDLKSDVDYAYLAFKYDFGSNGQAPVAQEPVTQTVTTSYTLDANTTFGFDSAALSEEGKKAVSQVVVDAQNANLQFVKYNVDGYTDRLGSDAYNQKLSEKRANAVAQELVSLGVQPGDIVATGHGSADPVTGDACNTTKARKDLIKCLAPDRRVVVNVSGTSSKTESVQQPAAQ